MISGGFITELWVGLTFAMWTFMVQDYLYDTLENATPVALDDEDMGNLLHDIEDMLKKRPKGVA